MPMARFPNHLYEYQLPFLPSAVASNLSLAEETHPSEIGPVLTVLTSIPVLLANLSARSPCWGYLRLRLLLFNYRLLSLDHALRDLGVQMAYI
jgi:hypothetical protein